MTDYDRLGNMIRRETPYGIPGLLPDFEREENYKEPKDLRPASQRPPNPQAPIEMEGLRKGNGLENGKVAKMTNPDDLSDAEQRQCLWWYFDGKVRRVSKAIRIRYTFTHPETGQSVTDHVLVGYEGPSTGG